MERIKRSLMLLKPGEGISITPGKFGGVLKMQSAGNGLALNLITDCLENGDYDLHLFSNNGDGRFAGHITGNSFNGTLYDTKLDDVAGAAVIDNAHHFCLKSTGMDWHAAIERYRLARTADIKTVSVDTAEYIADKKTDVEEIISEKKEAEATSVPASAPYTPPDIDNNNDMKQQSAEQNIQQNADENPEEQNICDACPHVIKQDKINPFPAVFPHSEWVKISYPGPTGWWHYISGKILKNGTVVAKVLGVPGEFGMAPPIWLEGFGTYMRCVTGDARGYWLMFQDAVTGEVLDMGLSPHGV